MASASASKTYSFRDMKRESGSGPDWPLDKKCGEVRKENGGLFREGAAGKQPKEIHNIVALKVLPT